MLGGLRILVVDVKDSILTFLHVLDADTGFSILQVSKVVPLAVPTGLPVFHCSFSSFSADRPMMGGELELVSLQHNWTPNNMNIHLLQDYGNCEPLYLGQLCNATTTERVVSSSVDLLWRDSTRDRLCQHTAQKISTVAHQHQAQAVPVKDPNLHVQYAIVGHAFVRQDTRTLDDRNE